MQCTPGRKIDMDVIKIIILYNEMDSWSYGCVVV